MLKMIFKLSLTQVCSNEKFMMIAVPCIQIIGR